MIDLLFPSGVCVCMCHCGNHAPQWTVHFWSKRDVHFLGGDFGSLQTSLLCIVQELAGEGYMAVAVGVSDM